MIRCWFIQSMIAWNLDADRPVPSVAQKHLEGCPNCRHFYQAQIRLIRELKDAPPPASPSPFLQARILHALEETEASGPRLRRTTFPSMAGVWAAGLAAVAIVAAVAFLRLSPTRPAPHLLATASASFPVTTNLTVVNGQKLIALGSTLETPLKQEMQFLVNDAKNAINSLAMNCLPAEAADVFGLP